MSGRVRIVIPDDHPPVFAGTDALDALHDLGEVALYETPATSRDLVVERCRDAAFVVNIRSITPFDAETLAALPLLRLIAVFGAGTDNIDLAAATRQGIAVANAPGANARSVAEHAFALLLAVARAVPAYDRDVRAGLWQHSYEGTELEGKTLGLLGLGQIGGHVARIAAGFGMRVIAWSRSTDEARAARLGVEQAGLETLLASADAIVIAVALSETTRGLLGAGELALLKPGALLINVSRGAIVVEEALVAALRTGALRGAGLDVFSTEPLPLNSPLRDLPNVVLTPHAGWATREARQRLLRSPVENIRAFLGGWPKNLVGTGR
jgi:phosphoglycerate dehydrogenase-like enzyme